MWVGESGDLSGRAKDLFRTKNHSYGRLLGAKVFGDRPDVESATNKKSFSPEIEIALTEFMECKLSFLVASMTVGRKQVEDRACARTKGLLNIRKQRHMTRSNAAGQASNCRATVRIPCQSCALVTPSTLNAVMQVSSRPRRASSPSTACDSDLRTDSP